MTYRETDKLKALAIVNIFETGKAFGDFEAVAVLDDGAGISYGVSQFTHRSGSLAVVIERYFEIGGTVEQQTIRSRETLLKKKDRSAVGTLANDEEFKKALRSAALTKEMQTAQMQITFERYLKPALDICEAKNFVLPISLAVVYDSVTHGSWEKISERVRQGDAETRGRGEKDWITEYVRERDKWLTSVPRLKKTSYRTRFFLKQIAIGHWNLELPLNVNGVILKEGALRIGPIQPELPFGQIDAAAGVAGRADTPVRTDAETASEKTSIANISGVPNMTSGPASSFAGGTGDADKSVRAPSPAENPPETLPGSPETDRSQTRAVRPPSQEAVGSGSGSKQEKTESESESCLDKAEDAVNAAAAKYDQAERIAKVVITRTDSAKSLWTTVAGTIWQTVWGIAGFLSGMPRTVWLVVAVIAGALMIGYLYRQIALGRIRESSKLSQNQNEN